MPRSSCRPFTMSLGLIFGYTLGGFKRGYDHSIHSIALGLTPLPVHVYADSERKGKPISVSPENQCPLRCCNISIERVSSGQMVSRCTFRYLFLSSKTVF
ncbi:hypothetical protein K435DRAFT_512364 [Dendrothele bispora CBS 962.96]|uniref:Uncharacterized protein n=1 Tax=Dendrothele bispora (strain CBS 962.96) TaxID=1314807 RepID=A0A4S8KW33_DENBC|nr:hypothetical protein K435DRAFT_512364 [Dendrothele bispora CBS 962.96]